MPKILKDIQAPAKKNITLQENKRKRGELVLMQKSKNTTEGLYNRKKSAKKKTWLKQISNFSKLKSINPYSNIFQFVTIGVVMIFVINIFSVIVKTSYLKEEVSYSASQAYQNLVHGGENILQTNFNTALNSFEDANKKFEEVGENLWFLRDKSLASIESNTILNDASKFIRIGENLSKAGTNFTQAFSELQKAGTLILKDREEKAVPDFELIDKPESITDVLSLAAKHFKDAENRVNAVIALLEQINSNNHPEEYRLQMANASLQLKNLSNYLATFNKNLPVIQKLLGDKHPHTYLVLFHNSNEIRPVLGFIGSYALVDVDEGYIEQLKIKDIYELDGQFYEDVEGLPEEISGRLKMRDSNYSPDASISLKNAAWFYQKQGGKSVNTVISIDQNVLGQILSVTGPLEVPGLNAPITAENYDFIISYIVESKLYGETSPKAVLNDIFEALTNKLKDKKYHAQIAELAINLVQENKILAFSKDEQIQSAFKDLNLTGESLDWPEKTDALQIIRTSIGGNKSDKYIKQNYEHSTYISQNGRVTNRIKIELQHTWHEGIMQEWRRILRGFGFEDFSETIKDIEGRGTNKSGVRVYVPNGSELIDVIGFSRDGIKKYQDKDLNRDYFYFELEVSPQHTRTLQLQYQLPFELNVQDVDTYKFIYEPQIGAKNVKLTKLIRGDTGLKNHKNFPEQELSAARTIEYFGNGTKRHYFAGVWGN